jgi:hypothetical protein
LDGSSVFELTYQTGGSYTVSLSETASRKVGSYSYTAKAEAEGGASETVSQTFTVTRRCESAEKSTLITDTATSESAGRTHLLYIPATSTENVDIFESSASYVDDPAPDDGTNGECGQTFSLQNYDGTEEGTSIEPGLAIDPISGKVTVTKDAASKDDYSFKIKVTNSGGTDDSEHSPDLIMTGFIVQTRCGPSSTIVTAPLPDTIDQIQYNSANGESAEALTTTVSKTGFTTSNPTCVIQPLTGYVLTSGSAITMDSFNDAMVVEYAATSTDKTNGGTHTYTITATAEGGADDAVTGDFLIYHYCYATARSSIVKSITFDVPYGDQDAATNAVNQHEAFFADD